MVLREVASVLKNRADGQIRFKMERQGIERGISLNRVFIYRIAYHAVRKWKRKVDREGTGLANTPSRDPEES
jgi:hypothetical protein